MGQTDVDVYLPNTTWYDYFTVSVISCITEEIPCQIPTFIVFFLQGTKEMTVGQFVTMHTPLDKINLHIRGGYIIPWQYPANNTYYRLETSFYLSNY